MPSAKPAAPEPTTTTWRYTKAAYIAVFACWAIYAALTMFAPTTNLSNRLGMSQAQVALLRLTIIIPVNLIWLLALKGALAFKSYSAVIQGSRESSGINLIANGLLWTVVYLILTSLPTAILQHLTGLPSYNTLVIIRDHLPPLAALLAFYMLYRGSHDLRTAASFTTWTSSTFVAMGGFAVFAVFFVLQFAGMTPNPPTAPNRNALSLLPQSVTLFTIVIPYLAAWFMGLLAALNIAKFARRVKGKLYRLALRDLVLGVITVVTFAITVQLLNFAGRFFTNIGLGQILLILYALMVLYALGFYFVGSGAKKLMRIEAAQ